MAFVPKAMASRMGCGNTIRGGRVDMERSKIIMAYVPTRRETDVYQPPEPAYESRDKIWEVVALLVGWFALDESVSPVQIGGIVLILAAVLMVVASGEKTEEKKGSYGCFRFWSE